MLALGFYDMMADPSLRRAEIHTPMPRKLIGAQNLNILS